MNRISEASLRCILLISLLLSFFLGVIFQSSYDIFIKYHVNQQDSFLIAKFSILSFFNKFLKTTLQINHLFCINLSAFIFFSLDLYLKIAAFNIFLESDFYLL